LARRDSYQGKDWFFGPLPELTEDTIEVRLVKWQYCFNFHRPSAWYNGPSLADQPIHREKQDTHILMLHANLSHGLDLSFVTHIFLLEPIEDAALLEQVTSRAHRLGATGPVHVHTVNVFYKTSDMFEQALSVVDPSPDSAVAQDVGKSLSKVVCDHCFRTFDSKEACLHHERNSCPRNPTNMKSVDPYHLSSVYREIRPPPGMLSKKDRVEEAEEKKEAEDT
jgi:hypothetical protein